MHRFEYRDGELYCEDVRVRDVVAKYGTPLYLYSRNTFKDHFYRLQEAFKEVRPIICYSVKANSNLAVLDTLRQCGAGFDVVSSGEIFRVQQIGADPRKVVYASVGKDEADVRLALDWGILMFNVESEAELCLINNVAQKMGKRAKVALRINPDVDARTHDYITTAKKENKFGIDLYTAETIFANKRRYPNVEIVGLHIHIGSQIIDTRPYLTALEKVKQFISRIQDYKPRLKYLNIGGGLGIRYKDERPDTADRFAERVLPTIKSLGLRLIMEPGRFIAGNSGIFLTKVIYVKRTPAKNFVVVDGGMNDLIRPSLYKAYHFIWPIEDRAKDRMVADVVGPICESGDFFAKDRDLPVVDRGDVLAVFSAGAYGFVMASNYNSRPRPAEVIVDKDKVFLIRKRESFKDLIRGEKII